LHKLNFEFLKQSIFEDDNKEDFYGTIKKPPVYIAASKRKVRITQMLIYAGADLMGPVQFGGKNLT
jgi:hypothetical protein